MRGKHPTKNTPPHPKGHTNFIKLLSNSMSDLTLHNNAPAAIKKVRHDNGDLSKLTEVERKIVYIELCKHYGFDSLSFPLDYIKGDKGTLKIYVNSAGASQLRERFNISVEIKSREFLEDMWVVVAIAKRGNRTEEATGAASILNKYGESSPTAKVNALKRAETQAKRRATLNISGFGWDNEDKDKIINAEFHDPPADVIQPQLTHPPLEIDYNICKTWKSPADAIAWARIQIPTATDVYLQEEMNCTAPINGKVALGWVKKISEMKVRLNNS